MSEIMKIIDEREMQKEKQNKKEQEETEAIVKGWELNDFGTFKLGFLQLICKASSIFNSNLEIASSIKLKQRELYESKHVVVEFRCLKIWDVRQA